MKLPLPLALLVAAAAATSVPDCTSADEIVSSDDGVFAFKCVKLESTGTFVQKFHGCYMKDANLQDTLILSGRKGYANGSGVVRFGFRQLCSEKDGQVFTTTDGCYVMDKHTGQLRDLEIGDSTTYEDNEDIKLTLKCFRDPEDNNEVRIQYSTV